LGTHPATPGPTAIKKETAVMNNSTYSGWRKSSYSSGTGNCVEVAFTGWRKSSRSDGTGNCVEVATTDGSVGVRDSKQHGHGPVLELTRTGWEAFVRAARDGEFDLGPESAWSGRQCLSAEVELSALDGLDELAP
jgi:hypothetical protein